MEKIGKKLRIIVNIFICIYVIGYEILVSNYNFFFYNLLYIVFVFSLIFSWLGFFN